MIHHKPYVFIYLEHLFLDDWNNETSYVIHCYLQVVVRLGYIDYPVSSMFLLMHTLMKQAKKLCKI